MREEGAERACFVVVIASGDKEGERGLPMIEVGEPRGRGV
jgi:hypothetical protein